MILLSKIKSSSNRGDLQFMISWMYWWNIYISKHGIVIKVILLIQRAAVPTHPNHHLLPAHRLLLHRQAFEFFY